MNSLWQQNFGQDRENKGWEERKGTKEALILDPKGESKYKDAQSILLY